jgi:hypothetical protein
MHRAAISEIRQLLVNLQNLPQTETFETLQLPTRARTIRELQTQESMTRYESEANHIKDLLREIDSRIDKANIGRVCVSTCGRVWVAVSLSVFVFVL